MIFLNIFAIFFNVPMRNHMQALEHFFDVVVPKAGMVESSRTLLKEKTAYTCRSTLTLYSRNLLIPNTAPERTYNKSGGYNCADVISGIVALSPSDMWRTSRKEEELLSKGRVVSVTDDAAKKKDDAVSTETVFSNQALPVEFFRDFLKAHSCKALSLS